MLFFKVFSKPAIKLALIRRTLPYGQISAVNSYMWKKTTVNKLEIMWVLRREINRLRYYFGNFFTPSLIIPGNSAFAITKKPTDLLSWLRKASLGNIHGITDGNLNMIINFTHHSRVCDKGSH